MSQQAVHFAPFNVSVDISFWQELGSRKLDVLKLSTPEIPVTGVFIAGADGKTPGEVRLDRLSLEGHLEGKDSKEVLVYGRVLNFNTLEDFKKFDRIGAAQKVAAEVEEAAASFSTVSGRFPLTALTRFLVLSFMDLKKYKVHYSVTVPAVHHEDPNCAVSLERLPEAVSEALTSTQRDRLLQFTETDQHSLTSPQVYAIDLSSPSDVPPVALRDGPDMAAACSQQQEEVGGKSVFLVLVDPCGADGVLSWVWRNFFLWFSKTLSAGGKGGNWYCRVLVKKCKGFTEENFKLWTIRIPEYPQPGKSVPAAGWLFFLSGPGKKSSTVSSLDLAHFLDATALQANAVELNVKLIKWRMVPELEPERISQLQFLLIGAGTLGCAVARGLLGWGVRHFTFVDSGRVAMSNPVRQSLFTHKDAAAEGCSGLPKAVAAAERLREVRPDIHAEGVKLEIPLPGHTATAAPHPPPGGQEGSAGLLGSVQKVRSLLESHDVVMLLTDSRESRWLPQVLLAAASSSSSSSQADSSSPHQNGVEGKAGARAPLGVTVALGFDSFLVLRHAWGDPEGPTGRKKMGCYFCNDYAAPADAQANRTLDQQCTVTRPGVSSMAASLACELLASAVQHSGGFGAPPTTEDRGDVGCLGAAPQAIRGFLNDFRLSPQQTDPFEHCIGCSDGVVKAVQEEGDEFLLRVLRDPVELERVSGLSEFKEREARRAEAMATQMGKEGGVGGVEGGVGDGGLLSLEEDDEEDAFF
uniref:Autophagy-related protein 7 n=1 Tax=Chromera velia CCMP2878 TaxID=1169474 RepID=A0A0G4F3B7_9ALVE|eukprot:Cvel_14972.t1-p1 / transcript=Cvel_14972.t1 / gene=Cvel_14972 / organism=Chromera_velia_CCMP2878 / gene_product=Ubiquitin-like modifier-activating enzyme atg7, putative / transcript_product=Ubiquitin-like modifier-activating enzyme atg7, putative / location=Cvel_scaffold1088:280-4940(-) / protein_length=750 / sequence_SO=supercontig / SO=protein_coding / is_pseudo=false